MEKPPVFKIAKKDANLHKAVKNQLIFQTKQKDNFTFKISKIKNEEKSLIDPIFLLESTINSKLGIAADKEDEEEEEESESEVEVLIEKDSVLGLGNSSEDEQGD